MVFSAKTKQRASILAFFVFFQYLYGVIFLTESMFSCFTSTFLSIFSGNCAWRYLSSGYSWNVALPDFNSKYHISLLYFPSDNHVYEIQGDELPYARYFSFQIYAPSIKHGNAIDFIHDRQIVTDSPYNMNAYENLIFARRLCRQGTYSIFISNNGGKGLQNEIQGLQIGQHKGWCVLFFRLYSLKEDKPPGTLQDCYHTFPNSTATTNIKSENEIWGWVNKPRIFLHTSISSIISMRREGSGNISGYKEVSREILECKNQWNYNEILFAFFHNGLYLLKFFVPFLNKPVRAVSGSHNVNRDNNIYLPSYNDRIGTFNNHDARYLGGAADTRIVPKTFMKTTRKLSSSRNSRKDLWALVTGSLPLTAGGLYKAPFIANTSAYDIRYISFSSGDRSFPLSTHSTISDNDIKKHYKTSFDINGKFRDQSNEIKFDIWIGPENAKVPFLARKSNGIILRWPCKAPSLGFLKTSKIYSAVDYPGFLIRQLYSVDEMRGKGNFGFLNQKDSKLRKRSVAGILPKSCFPNTYECCGDITLRDFCHSPEFLSSQLKALYPNVTYYLHLQTKISQNEKKSRDFLFHYK